MVLDFYKYMERKRYTSSPKSEKNRVAGCESWDVARRGDFFICQVLVVDAQHWAMGNHGIWESR